MSPPWSRFALWVLGTLALTAALQAWVSVARRDAAAVAASQAVDAGPPLESCQSAACHAAVVGIEPSHDPRRLGCATCHLGDPGTTDPTRAHAGLVRIPGNAADLARTCGAAGCHPEMPARFEHNVMTTMNGVVSVDRWVFGEQPTPTAVTPVKTLGQSPADTHLRGLCASCHLAAEKTEAGPIREDSRGGGCNACHLQYWRNASHDVEVRAQARAAGRSGFDGGMPPLRFHPRLKARPINRSCFGCHSRSGRISLSFDGWAEEGAPDAGPPGRDLADGRRLVRQLPDVHAVAGVACVDCHSASEVMGEGGVALHREDQQLVACTDCHRSAPGPTAGLDGDPALERLARLEARDVGAGRRFLALAKTGRGLVSTRVLADGGAELERPGTTPLPLRAPTPACETPAHRALACATCHDAWAPQCLGCHTQWDLAKPHVDLLTGAQREGSWVETPGVVRLEPPTLGVRERAVDGGVARRVEEFTPGMVLTLARTQGDAGTPEFHRLFAPAFPHTVQKASRTCASCHADPVALGYGRGRLAAVRAGKTSRWRFTPKFPAGPDGLPQDAWVPFLGEPDGGVPVSTREDARPFSVEEQRRVLSVGLCLGCHPAGSKVMDAYLADPSLRDRVGPRCVTLAP